MTATIKGAIKRETEPLTLGSFIKSLFIGMAIGSALANFSIHTLGYYQGIRQSKNPDLPHSIQREYREYADKQAHYITSGKFLIPFECIFTSPLDPLKTYEK